MLARGAAYDCETCRAGIVRIQGPDGKIQSVSKDRYEGCHGPAMGLPHMDDETDEPIDRCPKALLLETEWWPEFEDAWYWREHGGCWPVGGGWMDQSAIFLDAIKFLNGELGQYGKRHDDNR
jgi:hypothetical protein